MGTEAASSHYEEQAPRAVSGQITREVFTHAGHIQRVRNASRAVLGEPTDWQTLSDDHWPVLETSESRLEHEATACCFKVKAEVKEELKGRAGAYRNYADKKDALKHVVIQLCLQEQVTDAIFEALLERVSSTDGQVCSDAHKLETFLHDHETVQAALTEYEQHIKGHAALVQEVEPSLTKLHAALTALYQIKGNQAELLQCLGREPDNVRALTEEEEYLAETLQSPQRLLDYLYSQ